MNEESGRQGFYSPVYAPEPASHVSAAGAACVVDTGDRRQEEGSKVK